jgi:hypothetical protein
MRVASMGNLAICLLLKFDTQTDIKSFFLEEWRRSTVYERKENLMWRVLDDENLSLAVHEDIYRFISDDMNKFIAVQATKFEGTDYVLSGCKARLSDPSFPRTKD